MHQQKSTVWMAGALLATTLWTPLCGVAQTATGDAKTPERANAAPTGYRDFRLGMTRAELWQTFTQLGVRTAGGELWVTPTKERRAKESSSDALVIPSYEHVRLVVPYFTDGLGHLLDKQVTNEAPLYEDAELFGIGVDFTPLPRPVGDFMESFAKVFGKPEKVKRLDQMRAEWVFSRGGNSLDLWYEWRWSKADVGAWLYSTPDDEAFIRHADHFAPRLIIERGVCTFERECMRHEQERKVGRAMLATAIAAGATGTTVQGNARSQPPPAGTFFFGAPITGRQIFCLAGPDIWTAHPSSAEPLESRPDAVAWRELRSFIGNLPPAAGIPSLDRWNDVYIRPDLPDFLPAVTRTKARNLRALRSGELAGAIAPTSTVFVGGLREVVDRTRIVPLREDPFYLLDRIVVRKAPDTVLMLVSAQDFPVTEDAVLTYAIGKTLPNFEIVEIRPGKGTPKPHQGLAALAKVSGGRYRIWIKADQPLVTIVESEDAGNPAVEPKPAPVPR